MSLPASSSHVSSPGPGTGSGSGAGDGGRERDAFHARELAIVLSHYDLGVIDRLRTERRGSRRAPKLRIETARGSFLLKRRAPGRNDVQRVAFAQRIQHHLADRGFPVARLIPTQSGDTTMLVLHERVYELFEYVEGDRDDGTPAAAEEAGRVLARLHHLLRDAALDSPGPASSYHAADGLDAALGRIPGAIAPFEPGIDVAALARTCADLGRAYAAAARRADALGLRARPGALLHGDWHPGNLLYRDGRIAAALDFDSARTEPRVIDVANAALQFSVRATDPEDPSAWPEALDLDRFRAVLRGYHHGDAGSLGDAELRALPLLVIEALIVEGVAPIAATGRFGRMPGSAFLGMIERKVGWIETHADALAAGPEGRG